MEDKYAQRRKAIEKALREEKYGGSIIGTLLDIVLLKLIFAP